MKITLRSTAEDLGYVGVNDRGQVARFSGSKAAVSPMEHVLMAAAACSAIDVELFLRKMRAPAQRVEVDAEAERAEGPPAVFTRMHLHYRIFGHDVKDSKAAKAVALSMDQYCSVSLMLRASVAVTHSYEVLGPGGGGGDAATAPIPTPPPRSAP